MADRDTQQSAEDAEILRAVEDTEPGTRPDPTPVVAERSDPAPDPRPAPPQAPEPARGSSGSGFLALLLGGALAAAGGFALARYVIPGGWPMADTSALEARLDAQIAETAALKAQLADLALPAPAAIDPALQDRIAALENAPAVQAPDAWPLLAPMEARLAEMTARLDAIEAMPGDGTSASPAAVAAQSAALAALQAEVAALKGAGSTIGADFEAKAAAVQAQLDAATAQAAQLQADAATAGRVAIARAALGRVQAALDSGAPFADALGDLGATSVPEVLANAATGGIPTLADLQATYPAAARAALDASIRSDMGATWTERLGSFFRTQTGARSLTPQEGTGPDAVLSRTEAALKDGLLAQVVSELAGLPPEGQAEMAPWLATVQQRIAAVQAVATLVATLGTE